MRGSTHRLLKGTVCKILGQGEIKPNKVRYYLERAEDGGSSVCLRRGSMLKKAATGKSNKSD